MSKATKSRGQYRRNAESDRGATLLEFSLVVSVLFLFVFGIIEVSRLMTIRAILSTSAQRALSLAIITPQMENDLVSAAQKAAKDLVIARGRELALVSLITDVNTPSYAQLYVDRTSGADDAVDIRLPARLPGEQLWQALLREPINVRVTAQISLLFPFMGAFSMEGHASGYWENRTLLEDTPPDCTKAVGVSPVPPAQCACTDPRRTLDSGGNCVCSGNQAPDAAGACDCSAPAPGDAAMSWNAAKRTCTCTLACGGNTVRAATGCRCVPCSGNGQPNPSGDSCSCSQVPPQVTCPAGQHFNRTQCQCAPCGSNSSPDPGDASSCKCAAGFWKWAGGCAAACPAGRVKNPETGLCVNCFTAQADYGLVPDANQIGCTCPASTSGQNRSPVFTGSCRPAGGSGEAGAPCATIPALNGTPRGCDRRNPSKLPCRYSYEEPPAGHNDVCRPVVCRTLACTWDGTGWVVP